MRRSVMLGPVLLMLVCATEAAAMPAFARKYRVTCSMCHSPAPRLNAFGEMFAANGFEFAPGEPARDTIDTGDPLLRLQRELPLAIRVDAYVQALTSTAPDQTRSDLQTPYNIKLLSGGPIANKVSYYLYFFLSERGEVAGLEDAYLQFSDIGGSGISLLAGQFQVSDPLFKRELRLEFEDYQAYRVRVGGARADLTYERGFMATAAPWTGADIAVQLLNGRGLTAADERKQFDRDDWKTYAIRLSQEIGRVRLGGFAYAGTERNGLVDDDIRVWGPDLTLAIRDIELNGQYLRRADSRPFFGDPGPRETTVDLAFAELLWAVQGPTGRWFLTGLYNRVWSDEAVFRVRQSEAGPLDKYEAVAGSVSYLLGRHLRLLGEVQWDFVREGARFTAGVIAAF